MNWMKFRPFYFLISSIAVGFSLYAIFVYGFKLSIDFTGGTIAEYNFSSNKTVKEVKSTLQNNQLGQEAKDIRLLGQGSFEFRFGTDVTEENALSLRNTLAKNLSEEVEMVRFETVGPVLSQEILQKTYVAVGLAAILVLIWVAMQFKSFKLGAMAVIAVTHDLIILLGVFAFLGRSQGVEIDILFVTAMLTVFSLSLYDTIVIYDRIRENSRKMGKSSGIIAIVNTSLNDTIVRSFNTSLTTAFTLFALFLMGGASIKWFSFALLVGIITGTYSSPFVAVPLLATWDQLRERFKK